MQELPFRKDRIEKLIATMLSDANEYYTKLNQIVKESVKVVLSENNKKLISISFVALIQTLKDDPEMIKLSYNIPRANDGEQHKDNDINITQYFESNKDRILDLAEKNYQNLVKVLTGSNIDNAMHASSNPTLLLPQSSSTFPGPSNKIATYGIEESENVHNSKGDIAD